jgi:hypothetical protein
LLIAEYPQTHHTAAIPIENPAVIQVHPFTKLALTL